MAPHMVSKEGFFGRRSELRALEACVAEVEAGRPRLVVVEGAAGIGKTALVAALLPVLAGWRRLTVTGDEAEARLPYGLLARLLSGADAGWAAGTVGVGTVGPDEADPFVVGAQLLQTLGDMEVSGPVAVIVDDAPWADPASLRALAFALRRLRADRVLTVLTMRPEDASRLPAGLVRQADDDGARIRLTGLEASEVGELAVAFGCGVSSRRAAERLRQHTGGSPLYLRALFEELPVEELRRTEGLLPAPASFARLVLASLAGCHERSRRLITAAAVLGVRCRLSWAAAVGQVDEPLEALEDAVLTKLVDARCDEEGSWVIAFRHPLIRLAVYDDIGPGSRRRLHSRAADVADEGEALLHRVAAAGSGPDPELVSVLTARAEEYRVGGAPAAAADRLLAAARLTAVGVAQDRLVLEAVDLLVAAGEVNEAGAFADRLARMPGSAQRRLVQARLAWMGGRHDEVEGLAGSVWDDGTAEERAAAAAMLAQMRIIGDDNAGAVRWAKRALAGGMLAASVTSEVRRSQALALTLSGQAADGLRLLDDLPEGPTAVPTDRQPELSARGQMRMIVDDLAGARTDLQECSAGRPGWRLTIAGLTGLACLADVEYRQGSWDESLGHAYQAISLVADTGQAWLLTFVHAMAVLVLAGRGDWVEAQSHVRAAADAASGLSNRASVAYATNAAVHWAACRGDAAAVVDAAEPLWTLPRSSSAHEPGLFGWTGQYASALVAVGRHDDATAVVDRLAELGEGRARRTTLATIAVVRGELYAARGEPATARQAFETAVSVETGPVAALDRALAHAAYGRFLRRDGKRRAAGEHLRTAQDIFARLGARPFLDRCRSELAACGLAVDRPVERAQSALTAQEQAVTRLVCEGCTNREVAAELFLSVKTVGYHLGHAYAKLGVTSRSQLVALLARPHPKQD